MRVENGAIVLERGNDLTGMTWAVHSNVVDYEIGVEARRVSGNDFFCGLTFPVGRRLLFVHRRGLGRRSDRTLDLDGQDASENETTTIKNFEDGRWYAVRVRVTADRIQAWIDDAVWVDVKTAGRRIGIRPEVEASRPLGIASWRTTAALRNIRMRQRQDAFACNRGPVRPSGAIGPRPAAASHHRPGRDDDSPHTVVILLENPEVCPAISHRYRRAWGWYDVTYSRVL